MQDSVVLPEPEECTIDWSDNYSKLSRMQQGWCKSSQLPTPSVFGSHANQAGSRVYQKQARAFIRTLANPQFTRVQENLADIYQSSGEDPSHSPEFW